MSWNNAGQVAQPRSRVLVIYVGGTIGMRRRHAGEAASPLGNVGGAELARELLALEFGKAERISWELRLLEGPDGDVTPLDSSAVGPAHWLLLAAMLERLYADFEGFVILHGTDTLSYTASALSFLCCNLGKPVVLTGSQLPIFDLRSDARQNFLHALLVAGAHGLGLPVAPEVLVCFADTLLRGNRSRKGSTSGWQGFISPNFDPLGSFGENVRLHGERFLPAPPPEAAFYVSTALDDRVLDLTLFPGIRASHVKLLLQQPDLQGLVLRTYGAGNAPDDPELLDALGEAVEAGKVVLAVTQCTQGRVDLGRYASSWGLLQRGIASGFDLTPEAALTKLMWLLANESATEARALLQLDQRGEQSSGSHHLRFILPEQASTRLEVSARPGVALRRGGLQRAVLRLQAEGESRAEVFLQSGSRPPDPARRLAEFQARAGEGETLDVTEVVRRYVAEDRPVHLLLSSDAPLRWQRVELLLTVKSVP